jgi:ABC-2 type transport system permease protein
MMNMPIFKHEFRIRIKSVIIWSLAITAILMIFFSFYPVFADQAVMMDQLMDNFPPELRAAFGMSELDMSSVLGFYSFIFLFIQLCLAIQAGNYGFGLVSIEENELTADFLLTKPLSRTRVLVSKLLAVFASLLITNIVVWVSSFTAISLFRDGKVYDSNTLLLILSTAGIFQLLFLSVGLIISLLVRRVRSVTPYALGLAFGAYVLNAFSGMLGDVKLEYITPFKHFDPANIIHNKSLDTPLVLISVGVILISLITSFWLYQRRDIPAVS